MRPFFLLVTSLGLVTILFNKLNTVCCKTTKFGSMNMPSPVPQYPVTNRTSRTPPMVKIERASPMQSAPSSPSLPLDDTLLSVNYTRERPPSRPASAPPATLSFDRQLDLPSSYEGSSFRLERGHLGGELVKPPPPLCMYP